MSLSDAASTKKLNRQVWIVVIVAVVVLCCLLFFLLGAFVYLWQTGRLASILPGIAQPPAAPTAGPTVTLSQPAGPLVVEPFDPSTSNYPTLQDLVPGWAGSMTPASQTWSVSVSRNEPAMVFLGWCTTTTDILNFNFQHIMYKLVVDNQPVNVYTLYKLDSQESDRVCRTYVGLIRQWTGTSHTIVTTMTMDWALNDGWDDYPAGDYIDIYNITVSP